MKSILTFIFVFFAKIVFSQSFYLKENASKDPRFVWRLLTSCQINNLFIKDASKVAFINCTEFKIKLYFQFKDVLDVDSFYLQKKINLLDSTKFEYFDRFSEVHLDMDSLQMFNEIKKTKGMEYLLNLYLEPNSFNFKTKSLLFFYFLFENSIPTSISFDNHFYIHSILSEWNFDLYFKLAKTRLTKDEYEKLYKSVFELHEYE